MAKKSQTEEQNVELSETEKDALDVQKAAAENKSSGKKFKLADPKKSYQEAEFTLAGDQEKELPEYPSDQLIARIRAGFIVEA
ncbi:hypothetical protein WKH56_32975 [Priestia sp. SB1]|uniref:hypothetical protein n=1 Tax=Priestia sp. SB1 TaxID=3132359 RepID=UPI0031806EB2